MEDPNVLWARILVWTANILGLLYNVPQMYHTYLTKKVDDISTVSLALRFFSSLLWTFYSAYFYMFDVGISWVITLLSSILIIYYKIRQEILAEMNIKDKDTNDIDIRL